MLFALGEIGIDVAMILAVAGSIGCFAYLLILAFGERHEVRRQEAARRHRGSAQVLSLLPSSSADIRLARRLPPVAPRS